jgi:hypothetical protein
VTILLRNIITISFPPTSALAPAFPHPPCRPAPLNPPPRLTPRYGTPLYQGGRALKRGVRFWYAPHSLPSLAARSSLPEALRFLPNCHGLSASFPNSQFFCLLWLSCMPSVKVYLFLSPSCGVHDRAGRLPLFQYASRWRGFTFPSSKARYVGWTYSL